MITLLPSAIDSSAMNCACKSVGKPGCGCVVNVLASTQQEIAQQFATRAGDRFSGLRWRPGADTGAPIIDGSLAYAECKLVDTCKGGDHVILMGEIIAADAHEAEPLLYFRGRYGTYDAVVAPVVHPADIWEIW